MEGRMKKVILSTILILLMYVTSSFGDTLIIGKVSCFNGDPRFVFTPAVGEIVTIERLLTHYKYATMVWDTGIYWFWVKPGIFKIVAGHEPDYLLALGFPIVKNFDIYCPDLVTTTTTIRTCTPTTTTTTTICH
jgi:hypothetical protein